MTTVSFASHPMLAADLGVLPIVLILLAFGAAAGASYYLRLKRIKALRSWARRRGLTFHRGRAHLPEEKYFNCLRQGSRRRTETLMTGTIDGWKLKAFDYHYETYSYSSKGGRQTHHHYFSGVVVYCPFPLKHLFIRPEGIFDKVTEFVGMDDIDFESAEFSRAFYVKARDKRWAYDVITQDTMAFMLEKARGYRFELAPTCALVWQNRRMKPEAFEAAIVALANILGRIPEHVVRRQMEGLST
jgi:hypothetical protein